MPADLHMITQGKNLIAELLDKFFIKKPIVRRAITKLLYGEKSKWVNLIGNSVFVNSLLENGYYRASQLSSNSSFLRDELPIIIRLANRVSNATCFVDVGANIGIYAILMSRFKNIYPDFKVFAFEVHPGTYSRLNKNAEAYGFQSFNTGLGEKEATVDFVGGAVSHVTTRNDLANSYNIKSEHFKANIRTLASFDFSKKLVIKIDVEGQELAVLEGAERFFKSDQVDCVYLDGYGDAGCWDFLQRYGFDLFDGKTLMKADRQTFSLFALKR